jgi:transcriptional regulator with XRE-family HTH domain
MSNVVRMPLRRKPRTFTAAEGIIEALQEEIHISGLTSVQLAARVGVSPTTINNLRMGYTRWPRPTTLFPLMQALGLYFSMGKIKTQNVSE